MLTKRRSSIVPLAVAVILGVAGVGGVRMRRSGPPAPVAEHATTARITAGGSLTASVRAEPRSFNRLVAHDATSELVSVLTNAKLVRIDRRTQDWEPWLAEDVTALDETTYTLRLRDGVRFSDGRPLTSADVVFSFRAVYDEATASPLAETLRIDGRPLEVSAPDDRTVIVRFPSPFGPGPRLLDNLPILPRHVLESALEAGTLHAAWGLSTPPSEIVGLGPFVLDAYEPGQRLVFARNPHYWLRDDEGRPLPYLDRLVVEIVPEQNAEMLRLEAGDVDLIASEIRAEDYVAVRRAAGEGRLQLADLGVGLDPSFLWFNLNPEAKRDDPRHAWLQSRELRRAISVGVDRAGFADTVYLGAGVPVFGPVTPANKQWYSASVPTDAFDRSRARALLAEVGLEDRNADGMLEDATGADARFSLLTQKGHTARERGAAVVQEDLRALGIQVDVVALEPGALFDRFARADYDAMYFAMLASDTDPAVNHDFWLSSGSFHVWHPNQEVAATEWERRIDELMLAQAATVDQAERRRLFDEVQTIFARELPAIYFVAPRVFVAMGQRVANASPVVLRPQVLWDAEHLAVRQAVGSLTN